MDPFSEGAWCARKQTGGYKKWSLQSCNKGIKFTTCMPACLPTYVLTYLGSRLGDAKVSCIIHRRGVQLILAYSWARPAVLVASKCRGGMFLFLLLLYFHSCSFFPVPLFHLFYYLFYLFSPFLSETTQNDPEGLTCR